MRQNIGRARTSVKNPKLTWLKIVSFTKYLSLKHSVGLRYSFAFGLLKSSQKSLFWCSHSLCRDVEIIPGGKGGVADKC